MKTALKISIMNLFILALISLSYAQEFKPENGMSLAYHYGAAKDGTRSSLPAVYNAAAGERMWFSGDKKERFTALSEIGASGTYRSGIDIYNIPPSFVSNITYDFSGRGSKKRSGREFFDGTMRLSDVVRVGAAFLTNLAVHEFGHEVVAHYVDAEGSRLNFFQKSGGDFFLGTSSVEKIDERSVLSYTMGGEFFADLAFEHALRDYRKKPDTYNKSLLITSGADMMWYCFYAFYVSGDNPSYDPITISKETGLSRDALFSLAVAKTLINAYRVYSGKDTLVPYFKVDRYSTSLNFIIPFDIGS
ncbi:MAG: hypothetical protein AB1499_14735 [Nitrospirota bacterium]